MVDGIGFEDGGFALFGNFKSCCAIVLSVLLAILATQCGKEERGHTSSIQPFLHQDRTGGQPCGVDVWDVTVAVAMRVADETEI